MTETEWLACDDVTRMILDKRISRLSRRQAALYCVGCIRTTPDIANQRRLRRAVAAVEEALETGDWSEVTRLNHAAQAACGKVKIGSAEYLWVLVTFQFTTEYTSSRLQAVRCLLNALDTPDQQSHGLSRTYAEILRDVVGNPSRKITFKSEWRTDTVLSLAKGMYESRDFSAMPILADALQDAGCENADVLDHCRDEKHIHVRGCWVVDLVLGK
jgi:hypothetical protein